MKRLNAFCCVVALSCGGALAGFGQDTAQTAAHEGTQATDEQATDDSHAFHLGVDILSDTEGVQFQPYLREVLGQIDAEWLALMPEEAKPPRNQKGATSIRLTINPDGRITAMHLEGTVQDAALHRAAWGAITGVEKFPALPKEFHGPDLELRIHFRVNE